MHLVQGKEGKRGMGAGPKSAEIRMVEELGYHNRYIAQRAISMAVAWPNGKALPAGFPPPALLAVFGTLCPAVAKSRLTGKGNRSLTEILASDKVEFSWLSGCIAVLLQSEIYSVPANFATQPEAEGHARFAFAYQDSALGRLCGETAVRIADLLLSCPRDQALEAEIALRSILADHRIHAPRLALNHNLREVLQRADARGIPWHRIARDQKYAQLGQGCKLRRFSGVNCDLDGLIPFELQNSKIATHLVLSQAGLPIPAAARIRNENEALRAAEAIGYPVVLKPDSLGMGYGIFIGLQSGAEVHYAFSKARQYNVPLILEKFIPGDDHRLLVVSGKLVAAAKRLPAQVAGDGRSTIEELVREINKDPRRARRNATVMCEIVLDEESLRLLEQNGLTPASVPPAGETVLLKRTANISSGGTAVDVTDSLHPDNVALAERAARIMDLGLVGIDFLTTDISRSHFEVGGAICEVNAAVGLGPHRAANPQRDVTSPILARAFPLGDDGRIPTAAVTGTTGKTTTARMLAAILTQSGLAVGCATTDDVRIAGELVMEGDLAGKSGADMLFGDPRVEAAVLETARGGIISKGLAFEHCDVAAITNIGPDHLGEFGVETAEHMARIKGRLLQAARKAVILNANDPLVLAQRQACSAPRVILFAPQGANDTTKAHISIGGEALILEKGKSGRMELALYGQGARKSLMAADELPSALKGAAMHNAHNALCAAALALGMDQPLENIRSALLQFKPDMRDSPGRLAFIGGLEFDLLIDFAHNPMQLGVLSRIVGAYPVTGRRICMMTVGGNRRDSHIMACGAAVAGHFDRYICYERKDLLRGRNPGEISGLLRKGMIEAGAAAASVEDGLDIFDAVERSVALAEPGDLVAVLATAWPSLVSAFQKAASGKRAAVTA